MQALTLSELETFDPKNARTGGQRRFLCPVCGGDKPKDAAHRSLAVNADSGLYICHRCQTKGCLQEFWESRPITPKKQRTRERLITSFSFVPKRKAEKEEKPSDQSLSKETDSSLAEKMSRWQAEFLHSPAEMYLLGRGISTEAATRGGCGYAAKWEHWEKREEKWILTGTDRRVVFPIRDEKGELVAVHARAIDEDYFGSPKITKGDKSLGLFLSDARALKAETIALCEGAIDALALSVLGFPAAAMTGTTPPDWFYRKAIFKKILLAADADEAGDKAALKIKFELDSRSVKSERMRPVGFKDWGEAVERGLSDNPPGSVK